MSAGRLHETFSYWLGRLQDKVPTSDVADSGSESSNLLESNENFMMMVSIIKERLLAMHPSFYIELSDQEIDYKAGKYVEAQVKFHGITFLTLKVVTQFDASLHSKQLNNKFIVAASDLDGFEHKLIKEVIKVGKRYGVSYPVVFQ